MPSLTRNIPKESPLHKKLAQMVSSRIKFAISKMSDRTSVWQQAEETIVGFVQETDLDIARRNARVAGEPKYTTIKIPYTYALLMAAHTYWTSVFFARSPVHQFSGRHGETEDQVMALEALISYQVEVGEMLGPYYIWLYDAGKYGCGIIEEYWEKEEIQYTNIEEAPDPTDPTGQKMVKMQTRIRMPGYEGNKIVNISPFDFLADPRVPLGSFQKGEFCGTRKRVSWETIIRRKAQGYYMNTEHLRGTGEQRDAGAVMQGSDALQRPDTMSMLNDGITDHPSTLTIFEMHVSIIPSEWGLGDSDFPEKWVFTITGDYATIIGAQPHGMAHGRFPFQVLETEVEAYGLWNRGIPEIIEPVQNTLDWLINTHFFNVRAALNNQFLLDPSRIVASDAEDGGAGFIWRLRPEAYGQDVRQFLYQVPVQDMTKGHVADMQVMLGIGERITGINDQILGVLSGGGRKTATEVRTSTGFGVNRLKTCSEYMSATGFSQHAQRMVQNSQQFFSAEKKFRICGNLAMDAGPRFLMVTPEEIQGNYDFVAVDGTLPVDRIAMANLWKDILLQMRSVPGLILQYDLGKIFAYVANLAGIRNINQFRIQVSSPEALAQQADAGNIVPLKPGGTGGKKPAQVPGPSPIMPPQMPQQ